MKMKKTNRYSHAGKNSYEKEVYRNFLASKFALDKTEADPVDIEKTNESSFEEDDKLKKVEIQRKSIWLKIKDFLSNNWTITIVGGVIVGFIILIIGGSVKFYSDQVIQGEKIYNIEKSIEVITEENKSSSNNFNIFKENYNIFKTEIIKDLEYIKKRLKI